MRVLMITLDFPPQALGGIGRHTEELVIHLRQLGIHVTVLTMQNEATEEYFVQDVVRVQKVGPPLMRPFAVMDQNISLIGMSTLRDNMSLATEGLQLLSDMKFDIVHCQDIFGALAAEIISRTFGSPLILTKHFFMSNGEDIISKYLFDLERWIIVKSNKIICVSDYIKRGISANNMESFHKIKTIYSGTDIYNSVGKVESIDFLDTLNDKINIFLVGRLHPNKGGDIAIQALNILNDYRVRLVFVGDGAFRKSLEDLAFKLGVSQSILFTGYIDPENLALYYRTADIVLIPSKNEPFGLTVLEALSLGKAVLGSRSGGILEQIIDGYNGILFEPGNAIDLAEKLSKLINDIKLRNFISNNAKLISGDIRFSWRNNAELTVQMYRDALEDVEY